MSHLPREYTITSNDRRGFRKTGHATVQANVEIVERDGDVVEIVGYGMTTVRVIAEMRVVGDKLILDRLHLDGAGRGSSSVGELREMARELARQYGTKEIVIFGARRTTGAAPGKLPRPITIKAD